jgi:hypothetical protein
VAVRSAGTVAPPGIPTVENGQVWIFSSTAQVFVLDERNGTVLAQSSGLGSDIGNVFAPWGQRVALGRRGLHRPIGARRRVRCS